MPNETMWKCCNNANNKKGSVEKQVTRDVVADKAYFNQDDTLDNKIIIIIIIIHKQNDRLRRPADIDGVKKTQLNLFWFSACLTNETLAFCVTWIPILDQISTCKDCLTIRNEAVETLTREIEGMERWNEYF